LRLIGGGGERGQCRWHLACAGSGAATAAITGSSAVVLRNVAAQGRAQTDEQNVRAETKTAEDALHACLPWGCGEA